MHATQPQGGACPEPRTQIGAPENRLAALLTDPDRFGLCIARQVSADVTSSAALRVMPEQTDADGYVVTDAGLHVPTVAESTADDASVTAAQMLRNAALYLERYGWIQGAYYDATAQRFTPAACMVGAIGMVCYGGPVEAPAQHFDDPGYLDFEEAVLHLDRWLLVEDGSQAYEFNDAKGRRVEDVIHVLRHAAATTADELVGALRVLNGHDVHQVGQIDNDAADDQTADDELQEFVSTTDCLFCGAPGGYPYCQGSSGGRDLCAEVVAAEADGADLSDSSAYALDGLFGGDGE